MKIHLEACLALLVLGIVGPVHAQGSGQVADSARAQAVALAVEAARAAAPAGAQVTAEAGSLDSRVQLAACSQTEAFLSPGLPVWGHTRVGLRCLQGPSRWRVYLPVTVQVRAPAVVATVALPAGAVVMASQLSIGEVDWGEAASLPHTSIESVEGRALTHAVSAGQALRNIDLRPRQWFSLGDTVRIEAAGVGFTAVAEGQALSPGFEGQPARVRTGNGRVLTGRPVGDNRIEVSL
ncbi:MAG: flagellar basal body P-ring formation chaperone FlgA [Pseudomonadota bacterium]|nr:flagellar basal body P-ring formation chaperone FlgA [Pseudomonadota bacterium]